MKNSKNGFTLIELIIALAITVMILGTVFTIFILSTKIFSSVDVKSTLQTEAQTASDKISNIGMKAIKIENIELANGTIEGFGSEDEAVYRSLSTLVDINGKELKGTANDNEKYLNILEITIVAKEEVQGANSTDPITTEEVSYTIKYEPTTDRDSNKTKPRGILSMQKQGESKQVLEEDVENVTIKPSNTAGKLSQTDSIQFNINLAKKRGFSDVKYSIPINVSFRNK